MATALCKKLKNNTEFFITLRGMEIQSDAYYEIQSYEEMDWVHDQNILNKIESGDIIVNDGIRDLDESGDDPIGYFQQLGLPGGTHNHNDLYYQKIENYNKTEINNSLDSKANVSHPHNADEIITDISGETVQDVIDEFQTIKYFGTELQEVSSEEKSSTTSTEYQQKLRMTLTNLPEGKYKISFYFEWSHSNPSSNFKGRVQLDDNLIISESIVELADASNYIWDVISGFKYINLSGNHFVDIDFCSSTPAKISEIRRARLDIWRIS